MLVLAYQSVEVAIYLEELLVPLVPTWKHPTPVAGSLILRPHLPYHELLKWSQVDLLVVGFSEVAYRVAKVRTIQVSFRERADTNQGKQVSNEVAFDSEIEGRVGVHRRGHVDLHQPGLQGRVDQHIEPQDFKTAIVVGQLVHEGSKEGVFSREDRLDDQVVDTSKQFGSLFFADTEVEEVSQGSEAPLTAKIVLIVIFGFNEFRILLVYTVVSQVLKTLTLQVVGVLFIGFSCKPGKAFLVDVNPERIDSSEGDVDSKVELEAVDEEWVRDVVTHHQS